MKTFGLLGVAILIGGEALLLAGVPFVTTWFTPIMWTGYIIAADAVIAHRIGTSYLTHRRRQFALMAVLSVLSWLIFEVYNLRLQNWIYKGLPESALERNAGFFWSFATITPALFITADLLGAFGLPRPRAGQAVSPNPTWLSISFVAGLACVAIPPLLPLQTARFTFIFVWIGFILLLEPINFRNGAPSLYREWLEGRGHRVGQFLLAGFICGLLWEAWNYQALLRDGTIWIYTIPDELRIFNLHYGAMPLLGMLGFPPFALECFAIYHFLRRALMADR